MTTDRTIPEVSIDTQTLERMLTATAVGDVVPYTLLSGAIGRNVQTDARHHLTSARERVRRLYEMVFEPVVNVGMKRLDDVGIVGLGRVYRNRARRLAKRGRKKLVCVQDFAALPNELRIEHNTAMAQLGAVAHFTGDVVTKKIAGAIQANDKTLSLQACLDAMKSVL
jgi:hypothetical protein